MLNKKFLYLATAITLMVLAGCSSSSLQRSRTNEDSPKAAQENLTDQSQQQKKAKEQFQLGDKQLQQGNYQAAREHYTQALNLDPKLAKAYGARGVTYARQQEQAYEKALKDYDRAIALDPNLSRIYYNRGLAHANLENYQGAIDDFSKTLQRNPKFAEAYANRGITRVQMEDYNKAMQDLQKAADIFKEQGNTEAYQQMRIAIKYMNP